LNLKSVTAYSGLVALSLIWGMAFVAIKEVEAELTPINLALIRWLIAAVPFVILLPVIGRPKVRFEAKDVPRLLVVSLANVAGYHISLNYAETTLSAGLSALLIAFGPIFIIVFSYVLLDEKAGRRVLLGLVLAVVGTTVLSVGSINSSDFASLAGVFEALFTAFCYALFAVVGKPLVQKYGPASTTVLAGLLGTALMTPLLSANFFSQVGSLTLDGWLGVLYLGLLSTVFGYLMFYTLVSRGAVAKLSIQLYLIPVVSLIGGAILLDEPVTLTVVIGGSMMLAAVAVSTSK
jgi:drug/metabolite transporter (DMT)-like permease